MGRGTVGGGYNLDFEGYKNSVGGGYKKRSGVRSGRVQKTGFWARGTKNRGTKLFSARGTKNVQNRGTKNRGRRLFSGYRGTKIGVQAGF